MTDPDEVRQLIRPTRGPRSSLRPAQGPHDDISPSWYAPGDLVPTWNHVTAHLYGTPEILDA